MLRLLSSSLHLQKKICATPTCTQIRTILKKGRRHKKYNFFKPGKAWTRIRYGGASPKLIESSYDLRDIKEVHVEWHMQSNPHKYKSALELYQRSNDKNMRETNPNCKVTYKIHNSDGNPYVRVLFEDGRRVIFEDASYVPFRLILFCIYRFKQQIDHEKRVLGIPFNDPRDIDKKGHTGTGDEEQDDFDAKAQPKGKKK